MLAAVYHKGDHGQYCYTLKWESRLFSRLNAAKITNYIKKLFKWKLFRIEFHTKKSVDAHLYLSQEWS